MRKILFYFILCLLPFYYVNAQSFLLPSRPRVDSVLAPFFHGVASGDPLTDRIIIWTRVTTLDPSVDVDWQMATDTGFLSVVNSGTFTTDSSFDYTVKVDVTGLQPNNWYYYRFKAYNRYSITGRTRTLPIGNVDSLRIAFFSCSDFQAGYFNVYHDIANRNDIDMVMHLGDYYYEDAASASDTNRLHPETHDALSLTDYRLWNSEYKLDPDLRALFQQYPWIQIWDDHDVANNSWETGAQNHNPATQGSYIARKDASFKAYF